MKQYLEHRRREVAAEWTAPVLVGAGEPIPVPGRGDRTYQFRSHSEYFYLTDRNRPGGVLAFSPDKGWTDFVRPVTRDEQLWEGAKPNDVTGVPISELGGWLKNVGRPMACLGAPITGISSDSALEAGSRAALNRIRRRKDEVELDRMRSAARATAAGFAAIVPFLRPGKSEREIQIELEAEFFRNGADGLAFHTIVAGGPNSAILHFPPGERRFGDGDLVLIDAGAEVHGYDADVTRTYPVSGRFKAEQAAIYEIVLAAGAAAVRACTGGTEWRAVHRIAANIIADGLADFGVLRGEPEQLVESGAVSLFFPHGIGHMVGLGVRDAGEALAGREQPAGFPRLRVDLPLEVGHAVTVEPGIYFVRALLTDPELRARHRDEVDWKRVEKLLDFGGIRIENDVLVTDAEPEVLTSTIPIFS